MIKRRAVDGKYISPKSLRNNEDSRASVCVRHFSRYSLPGPPAAILKYSFPVCELNDFKVAAHTVIHFMSIDRGRGMFVGVWLAQRQREPSKLRMGAKVRACYRMTEPPRRGERSWPGKNFRRILMYIPRPQPWILELYFFRERPEGAAREFSGLAVKHDF